MFCINDADKARKSARSLEKFLAKTGVKLAHGQGLNAIAAMAGFADWNAMLESFNSTVVVPSAQLPLPDMDALLKGTMVPDAVVKALWTQPGEPELKRFRVEVLCGGDSLGIRHCLALNGAAAEAMALDALWDERVERMHAHIECEEVEYDDDGPFSIFFGTEWRDDAKSFAAAYRKAAVWHSVNPCPVIRVKDSMGEVLTKFM